MELEKQIFPVFSRFLLSSMQKPYLSFKYGFCILGKILNRFFTFLDKLERWKSFLLYPLYLLFLHRYMQSYSFSNSCQNYCTLFFCPSTHCICIRSWCNAARIFTNLDKLEMEKILFTVPSLLPLFTLMIQVKFFFF